VDGALRGHGVTLRQVAVLASLKRRPGQSNADLARGAHMTPQSMVEVLGTLEAAGLVARRPRPTGGRSLAAELTAAGGRELEACRATIAQTEARLLAGLTPAERLRLRALLEKWLEGMQAVDGARGR
jgi:DNA-binding MarR family transcriptional regulator